MKSTGENAALTTSPNTKVKAILFLSHNSLEIAFLQKEIQSSPRSTASAHMPLGMLNFSNYLSPKTGKANDCQGEKKKLEPSKIL